MPEHSRQALPKEKEEADCADKQPDPTHQVSDEKNDVVRTLRAVAVTGTISEVGHEPPPRMIETLGSVESRPFCSEDRRDARHRAAARKTQVAPLAPVPLSLQRREKPLRSVCARRCREAIQTARDAPPATQFATALSQHGIGREARQKAPANRWSGLRRIGHQASLYALLL